MLDVSEKTGTLDSILSQMDLLDAGLLELDLNEMTELGASLSQKTDGYKAILDRIEFRAAELKAQIDELTGLRRTLESKHDQIRQRMSSVMESHGLERLPGKVWNARLSKSCALEFQPGREKPNAGDLQNFPSWVEVSMAWRKSEIKREMQSGVGHLPGAFISERKSVIFKAAKE